MASNIVIYTDGGCHGNPGPGGWGFLITDPTMNDAIEACGGEKYTTNNRMEIMAAIMALKTLEPCDRDITIYSDSKYLIHAAKHWIANWKARGWTRHKGPLKNVDLLQELDKYLKPTITWLWVKGHASDRGNIKADSLATKAILAVKAGQDPDYLEQITWL